jgi:hypothetical protein
MALFGQALEYFIHARARGSQIGANARMEPALCVQIDNGPPSLVGIGDLSIGRLAPCDHTWFGSIRQHSLDRVVGELPAKTHVANGREFTQAKARIFRFEIHKDLAHLRRQMAPRIRSRGPCFGKQARHAKALKLVRLVVQRAFTSSCFFGPLGCGRPPH